MASTPPESAFMRLSSSQHGSYHPQSKQSPMLTADHFVKAERKQARLSEELERKEKLEAENRRLLAQRGGKKARKPLTRAKSTRSRASSQRISPGRTDEWVEYDEEPVPLDPLEQEAQSQLQFLTTRTNQVENALAERNRLQLLQQQQRLEQLRSSAVNEGFVEYPEDIKRKLQEYRHSLETQLKALQTLRQQYSTLEREYKNKEQEVEDFATANDRLRAQIEKERENLSELDTRTKEILEECEQEAIQAERYDASLQIAKNKKIQAEAYGQEQLRQAMTVQEQIESLKASIEELKPRAAEQTRKLESYKKNLQRIDTENTQQKVALEELTHHLAEMRGLETLFRNGVLSQNSSDEEIIMMAEAIEVVRKWEAAHEFGGDMQELMQVITGDEDDLSDKLEAMRRKNSELAQSLSIQKDIGLPELNRIYSDHEFFYKGIQEESKSVVRQLRNHVLFQELPDINNHTLKNTENILLLRVDSATLNAQYFQNQDIDTFVVFDFGLFDAQRTAIVSGFNPQYSTLIKYSVPVDVFLLSKLMTGSELLTFELYSPRTHGLCPVGEGKVVVDRHADLTAFRKHSFTEEIVLAGQTGSSKNRSLGKINFSIEFYTPLSATPNYANILASAAPLEPTSASLPPRSNRRTPRSQSLQTTPEIAFTYIGGDEAASPDEYQPLFTQTGGVIPQPTRKSSERPRSHRSSSAAGSKKPPRPHTGRH
ncbi:hypothetical protein BLNAU_15400 [Blattamonas nauphoetae]|uniref:RPGR-interacting protein 1 first C2 domain-containing protein n=1 Tax=Blattamonas nauphoetae TaxID=2049346 RepID=A0ABQ9XE17_9EUKA|nr:hypothetical protein BLNAU_15400 [Blattamonas nauphoetae]